MLTRIRIRNAKWLRTPILTFPVAAILFVGIVGAGPQLPKGDLAPPPRVRWAEPGDLLSDEPDEPEPPKPVAKPKDPPPLEDIEPLVIGNGYGSMGRVSHLAGKTFGRNDSITPLEFMPYILTDQHFVFADARGFVTNRSEGGGNFGVGYRRLIDQWNAWGGASVWYDADQSTGKMFQQVGLSFEGLINQWEFRSNVYLPFTSSQSYSNSITTASIVGNQLLYNRSVDTGAALRGVDFEAGYSLPVMERHIVRGFIGGYHFEGGSSGGVTGVRARAEAVINNAVTAQAIYTNDKLYGSNVMVGLSMQFPFGKNHPSNGWNRSTPSPFRFVERNYNVIVDRSQTTLANQVASDPTTGNPYVVEQVNSPTGPLTPMGTPDGTAAHPFLSIAEAQAAGGNVILVQSGSVLQESVTLTSGQHLFGQGAFAESLPTLGGGRVPIPNLLNAAQQSVAGSTPLFADGTGVTLASNTEVAGFKFDGSFMVFPATINSTPGPISASIAGTGVSNVSLHDLTFSSVSGDAINLTNSSGAVSISNVQINSATGNGIVLSGGDPNLLFSGGGSSISTQGNGFVLQNLTGGSVALNNLSVNNVGGSGLVMNSVAADATINSLSVTQSGSSGSAVAISGKTGTTKTINGVSTTVYNTDNFTGVTTISSPNGIGFSASATDARINIANLSVSSTASSPAVTFDHTTNPIVIGSLNVNTTNATGLSANQVSGLQINGGAIATVNAPAIDVQSSGFSAKLSQVSANGGAFGIQILGSTGNFVISGNNAYATGGTIQNMTTAGVIINSYGSTTLNWVDLTNNAAGIQSTGTNALALSNMRITGSAGYAIDSNNDLAFSLGSSILSGNGAVGGGTIREQVSILAPYSSNISSNTITDSNGTAVQLLTQSSAAGSTLTSSVTSNTIIGYGNGSPMLGVNWTGPASVTFNTNQFYAHGTGMTAIQLQDPSATAALTATMTSNAIYFQTGANSGPGIRIVDGQSGQFSTGSSNLTLTSNTIQFLGTGGTGLRFGLYEASLSSVTYNTVTDSAGGMTAMLYDYAAPNSSLTFNANKFSLFANDTMPHRGIVFTAGAPTVNLNYVQGSLTNWIYNVPNAEAGFSMPSGIGTGGILINNNYVAAP